MSSPGVAHHARLVPMQAGLALCPRPRQPSQPGQAQPTQHVAPVAALGPEPAADARSWFSQASTPSGARRGFPCPAGGDGPLNSLSVPTPVTDCPSAAPRPQHRGGTRQDKIAQDRMEQLVQFRLLPSGGSTAPGSAPRVLPAGRRARAASLRPLESRSRSSGRVPPGFPPTRSPVSAFLQLGKA